MDLLLLVVIAWFAGRWLVTRNHSGVRVFGYVLTIFLFWPATLVLVYRFYGMEPGAKRWVKKNVPMRPDGVG